MPDEFVTELSQLVNTISGLQRLKMAPLEQENAQMRNLMLRRDLAGPSPGERFEFEQEQYVEQQRVAHVKFALTTFSELSKDSSPANKAVLMEHMGSLWGAMNKAERVAAKMVYDHSPLNPQDQKAEWWDRTMKAPQVMADPEKDPYAYGVQLFNQDDYFQQRQNFVSGTPINKRKILGIGGDRYAYRGDDGRVDVMSTSDMALQQVAKENNTTTGALLASGGKVFGPDREISVGGHVFKTRSVRNVIEGKNLPAEFIPVKSGDAPLAGVENEIRNLATAYALEDMEGKTEGARRYQAIRAKMDAGASHEWIAKNILGPAYPGYNFAFVDPGSFSAWPIWGGYSPGKTEVMTYWRGEALGIPTSDGKQVLYYYDHAGSKVFDSQGRMISGSLPEFVAKVGSMTMEELKVEAKGGAIRGAPTAEAGKGTLKAQAQAIKSAPPKENLTVQELGVLLLRKGYSPERAAEVVKDTKILGSDGKLVDFEGFKKLLIPLQWTNEQLWGIYSSTWNALNAVGNAMLGVQIPGTSGARE